MGKRSGLGINRRNKFWFNGPQGKRRLVSGSTGEEGLVYEDAGKRRAVPWVT